MKRFSWNGPDSNCLSVLHDNFVNLGVALQVQILVNRSSGMDVSVSRVASTSGLVNGQLIVKLREVLSLTSRLIHFSQCSAPLFNCQHFGSKFREVSTHTGLSRDPEGHQL